MITININEFGHIWEKQNLITQFRGKKHYDILKCRICGIIGKSTQLGTITITEKYKNKIYNCNNEYVFVIPKKIKIIHCDAFGPQFKNLIPNSEHDVVEPPSYYKNDEKGVWVMGVGEPVKVLTNEYKKIE
jgi:hypothetical protein